MYFEGQQPSDFGSVFSHNFAGYDFQVILEILTEAHDRDIPIRENDFIAQSSEKHNYMLEKDVQNS